MRESAYGPGRTFWLRKSSYSGSNGGQCVEVCPAAGQVLVRDSKYARPAESRPIIAVPNDAWPTLLELALSGGVGELGEALVLERRRGGDTAVVDRQGIELLFTAPEWDAFAKGVADGQFDLE
ncbi:DUF397 domain-containing protein [Nocardia sp. NPDC059228]|uniref:DUF397 domain-containing protein n=1 Tax=Nocardia sp. NPDC059228 TaxID=3346777 RepID=UPI00368EE80E